MTPEDENPSEADFSPPPEMPPGSVMQASRLFILPAIVVGVVSLCLLLVGGLYALLKESSDPTAYLEQVVGGSGGRRWQAAYELSRVIDAADGQVDPAVVAGLVDAFEKAKSDDPKVRRYLTLALGRVKDPRCIQALRSVAKDPDVETRIYAILALGRQGDGASAPLVAEGLADEDSGVRMAAAYTLGFIGGAEQIPRLREAAGESDSLVTFNAAVALAQLGDAGGEPVLLEMLDAAALAARTDKDGNPLFDGEQVRETRLTAIKALAGLASAAGRERMSAIAAGDSDLRVRDLALKALAGEVGPPGAPGGVPEPR